MSYYWTLISYFNNDCELKEGTTKDLVNDIKKYWKNKNYSLYEVLNFYTDNDKNFKPFKLFMEIKNLKCEHKEVVSYFINVLCYRFYIFLKQRKINIKPNKSEYNLFYSNIKFLINEYNNCYNIRIIFPIVIEKISIYKLRLLIQEFKLILCDSKWFKPIIIRSLGKHINTNVYSKNWLLRSVCGYLPGITTNGELRKRDLTNYYKPCNFKETIEYISEIKITDYLIQYIKKVYDYYINNFNINEINNYLDKNKIDILIKEYFDFFGGSLKPVKFVKQIIVIKDNKADEKITLKLM